MTRFELGAALADQGDGVRRREAGAKLSERIQSGLLIPHPGFGEVRTQQFVGERLGLNAAARGFLDEQVVGVLLGCTVRSVAAIG